MLSSCWNKTSNQHKYFFFHKDYQVVWKAEMLYIFLSQTYLLGSDFSGKQCSLSVWEYWWMWWPTKDQAREMLLLCGWSSRTVYVLNSNFKAVNEPFQAFGFLPQHCWQCYPVTLHNIPLHNTGGCWISKKELWELLNTRVTRIWVWWCENLLYFRLIFQKQNSWAL